MSDFLQIENAKLKASLRELTEACESDCGVPDENDGDDDAVGASMEGPMALTFGMLRRARALLDKETMQ